LAGVDQDLGAVRRGVGFGGLIFFGLAHGILNEGLLANPLGQFGTQESKRAEAKSSPRPATGERPRSDWDVP
jgi:hypothetical protein